MFFTPKRLKVYLGALLVLQIFACISFLGSVRSGSIDFRSYYTAGYMLRTGQAHLLYDYATEQRLQSALVTPAPVALPFYTPPFTALLFVPLSWLPYVPSLLVFAVVNLALLALTARLMRPHLQALSARWRPLPPLLFFSFLPVAFTIMMGQLSILLLLLYCLIFSCLQRGRDLAAGLILSLCLMKFQIAIPIAVLFLIWRQWRFSVGFLSGATLLCALSAWMINPHAGPHALLAYVESITRMSALAGTGLEHSVGVSPRALINLYGFFFSLARTNRLATILAAIASIALLAWAATRRASFPLALLVAMLVSYHLYPCELTLLLLPMSLLCNQLFAEDDALPQAALRPSHFPWLQKHRREILFCGLGTFLIGPALTEIIANNLIFLLAVPVLALALCPYDWSTLALPQATNRVAHPFPVSS